MTPVDFTVLYVIGIAHFLILLFIMRFTDSITGKCIDDLRSEMYSRATRTGDSIRETNVRIDNIRREMDALQRELDALVRQTNARINDSNLNGLALQSGETLRRQF